MPTLDWIGKKAVVNHQSEVPYRLIHCDKSKSVGDPDAGNLLVQGDNLEALKALLPYYAGKVKCIYIDPPYNTGNKAAVRCRCCERREAGRPGIKTSSRS
jgi:adenine-specific DNA-methyltransferase